MPPLPLFPVANTGTSHGGGGGGRGTRLSLALPLCREQEHSYHGPLCSSSPSTRTLGQWIPEWVCMLLGAQGDPFRAERKTLELPLIFFISAF